MKRYYATQGFRAEVPEGGAVWVERTDEDGRIQEVGRLTHVSYHSPTGFAWGYAGSGPSELARCIFLDLFGSDYVLVSGRPNDWTIEPADGRFGSVDVIGYQDFKFAFVAGWSQSQGWECFEAEIKSWITHEIQRRRALASL